MKESLTKANDAFYRTEAKVHSFLVIHIQFQFPSSHAASAIVSVSEEYVQNSAASVSAVVVPAVAASIVICFFNFSIYLYSYITCCNS